MHISSLLSKKFVKVLSFKAQHSSIVINPCPLTVLQKYKVQFFFCISKNTLIMYKEMTRWHPKQSLDTLISLTILSSCKTLEQKFIFQISTHNAHGINKCFSLKYSFLFFHHHIPTNRVAPFSAYKHTYNPKFPQLP